MKSTATRVKPLPALAAYAPSVDFISAEGRAGLELQLKRLREEQLPAALMAAEQVREQTIIPGDTELYETLDALSQVEERIRNMTFALEHAVAVAERPSDPTTVGLYSRVTLKDPQGIHDTVQIVGDLDKDVAAGRLSHRSVLGTKLMGGRVGDLVVLGTPNGQTAYTITSID